jgi:predicted transcriptional regulator
VNILEASLIKALKENKHNLNEIQFKILNLLIKHKKLFLDEIIDCLKEDEEKIFKALKKLVELKLIEKELVEYKVLNPLETVFKTINQF